MSSYMKGEGYYLFPKTGWEKSLKRLWSATQKGATAQYDVLDVLYQVSKLIPRGDTMAFLQGNFDEPRSIPFIKTGVVKCPNATQNYAKEQKFKAGEFLTLEKDESLADWAEKIRFGRKYVGYGFGSRGHWQTQYPPGYNRDSLRKAVRFAFSKDDIPKISKIKTKSQPVKLSMTDTKVVESLPIRFTDIMSSYIAEDKKENGYIDFPRALNSTLMRADKATLGVDLTTELVYNSKKTKWRISEKGEEITASKSFDLYASGWRSEDAESLKKLEQEFYGRSKGSGISGQIIDAIKKTLYNDGEGTFYGMPQFYVQDISLKIKKTSRVDTPKNLTTLTSERWFGVNDDWEREPPHTLIKFDLTIKFKFRKPKEYKRLEDYYMGGKKRSRVKNFFEGNSLEPDDWRISMFRRTFGTLVPAMVEPKMPIPKKMPKYADWSYHSVTGAGDSYVSMEVDPGWRKISLKFSGRNANSYVFDSPGTAELMKILEETKWTKGTGGELKVFGEENDFGEYKDGWSFAKYPPEKK